jgi:Fe2+ transport system protein FeoA
VPNSPSFPLTSAGSGNCVRLERIRAGEKLARRLAELGLTPGVEFCVVQDAGGPLLLAVRGSRLALGRGMAHKMLVSPLPHSQPF